MDPSLALLINVEKTYSTRGTSPKFENPFPGADYDPPRPADRTRDSAAPLLGKVIGPRSGCGRPSATPLPNSSHLAELLTFLLLSDFFIYLQIVSPFSPVLYHILLFLSTVLATNKKPRLYLIPGHTLQIPRIHS
jgi:hypothetical protein